MSTGKASFHEAALPKLCLLLLLNVVLAGKAVLYFFFFFNYRCSCWQIRRRNWLPVTQLVSQSSSTCPSRPLAGRSRSTEARTDLQALSSWRGTAALLSATTTPATSTCREHSSTVAQKEKNTWRRKRRKEDVLESPKQQKVHLVFVFPSTEHHFVFPRKQCAPSAAYTHCRPLSQFFSCSLPILSAEFRSFLQQQCRFGAIGGKSRSNSIILWSTRAPGSLPELMSPQLSSVARHFP